MLGRIFRWLFGVPEPIWMCEWCSRGLHKYTHAATDGVCVNADDGCQCDTRPVGRY